LFARAGLDLPIPNADIAVSDICDDSRLVTDGACFVAVPGAKADGRAFVEDAVQRGAAVVVAESGVEFGLQNDPRTTATFVSVADAREVVARLSAAFHGLRGPGSSCPKLIGITGTNGKTTITWLLRSIFRAANAKAGLLGTVEYDTGDGCTPAPLTTPGPVELCRQIAQARDVGVEYMSLEVSSHALDQKRTDGLEFDAAVFTNLTGDHLDYHGTLDAYFAAKRRLFERLSRDSAAVINADDAQAEALRQSTSARVYTYSICGRDGDFRSRNVVGGRRGSRFTLVAPCGEETIRLPLVGEHNVANALAAAGAAYALGVDLAAIRRGLEGITGVPGRLQRVEPEGFPFSVLVDYAHTDDALRNVLRAVKLTTIGRIICVFGCGGNRDRSKRPRMAATVEELADVAVVTSDNPRHEEPRAIIDEILAGFAKPARCELIVEADRRAAIGSALSEAREGDTVLIAGKGHENYQIVGDCMLPFDDVALAREFLQAAASPGLREVCVSV
jgi:UDP-N-acetylmuramoyl-L-alanyl-D-glutamate--2,6-diaminopimelate ligase